MSVILVFIHKLVFIPTLDHIQLVDFVCEAEYGIVVTVEPLAHDGGADERLGVARVRDEATCDYLHNDFKVDDYDVIFIGFPNWYRSYPRIVAKFIRDNKWIGKTVIPFCTNEEGALGIGELELRASVKGAIIKQGFAERGYNASTCDERVKNWLKDVL